MAEKRFQWTTKQPEGIGAGLASLTQLEGQAASIRAQAFSDLAGIVQRSVEARNQRRYEAEQNRLQREFVVQRETAQMREAERLRDVEAQRAFDQTTSQMGINVLLNAAGGGLDPFSAYDATMQERQRMRDELFGGGQKSSAPPAAPTGGPSGGGGIPLGPHGPVIPGPLMWSPPQQGGGQQQRPGGAFSGVKRLPPPKTWEERKREMEMKDADELANIELGLRAYATGDGEKTLFRTEKVSRLDALGWGNLSPSELEAAVKSKFPDVIPVASGVGPDAKVDRSALDAQLRWLKEKQDVVVPMEHAIISLRQELGKGHPMRLVDKAVDGYFSEYGMRPARTALEASQMAKAKLVEEMDKAKLGAHPTSASIQAGSNTALQSAVNAAQFAGLGDIPPPSERVYLNAEAFKKIGMNTSQALYGTSLGAISGGEGLGYYAAPSADPNDPPTIYTKDGKPASQRIQMEFREKVWNDPEMRKKWQIMSGVPQRDLTPSEIEDAATLRGMGLTGPDGKKGQAPAEVQPGRSMFEQYFSGSKSGQMR